jgi:diguanylate cyclase (GGDEF)-like protein
VASEQDAHCRSTAADGAGRFGDASRPARALVAVAVFCAVLLPALISVPYRTAGAFHPAFMVPLVLVSSAANIELARLLEQRLPVPQRPHRALSVWGFVTALTVPGPWLLLVVPACYAHAYRRGLRAPVWKLTGSAAFVIVAGLAARAAQAAIAGRPPVESSAADLLAVTAAIAVFVGVEAALFAGAAWFNHAEQEQWLRRTLTGASFYLTEACLLAVGALSIAVWSQLPWLGVLLLPVYALLQRGALFEPLRAEATVDEKTRLLRFEAWRLRAVRACCEATQDRLPWAVLMIDLDHFKRFNTEYGHLAADELLGAVGRVLLETVRPDGGLACRFGGEEFAVLFVDADETAAATAAHRIRAGIAALPAPTVTASIGVGIGAGGADGGAEELLALALTTADRALAAAKAAGRDQVSIADTGAPAAPPSPRPVTPAA